VGGEPLPAGLKVLACPGHTPGNLVLVQENEGWLFSGDQLLPHITPTPGLQLAAGSAARFRSLPAFVRSLESLLTLDLVRCFPGHGEAFDDPAAVIRSNLSAIEARTEKVYEEMRSRGPCRVFALCERLYPMAARKRFWQILPTVVGHLDLLEDRGLVGEAEGLWHAVGI
jgi:glyoxylase-like metal-dependent hydrolase (beta-lactamase superfamily II)